MVSILLDANRVAPNRSHASDGIIGDATHAASLSDHNPDTDGGVHACDVTHDPAGGFDAWHWAQHIANRMLLGTETRVKYLVSNNGSGPDMIFHVNDKVWKQNGSYKTEHRNHLHVSILYTDAAENNTSPFFSADLPGAQDMPLTQADLDAIKTVVGNYVIGTLQTNLKDSVKVITNAVNLSAAASGGATADAIADAVANELHSRLQA